jgi:acetyl-CoA carboxylase biotin carboxyl carrier protein
MEKAVTTSVRDESAKNGVVRRHPPGTMRFSAGDGESADLEALCHHVASLARTRSETPSRIRVEHLGTALEIEWPSPVETFTAAGIAPAALESGPREAGPPAAEDGLHRICAPMIGTFFHSPEPGAPPFVSVGDTVVPGQQIGILEVMKMMSTVEAHVAGTVREILVPDGGPVEFQQPLIAVEPVGDR